MLYLPVDPTRDANGAIRVLVPLLGADAAHPYPDTAPTLTDATGISPVVKYYQTTQDAAAKLGVGDLFKVEASGFSQAAILDAVVGVPKYRAGTIDPSVKVLGTLWGFSVRLSMRVRSLDMKVGADLGYVAAAVQAGAADVQYSLTALGIDRGVFAASLGGLPLFGKLDYTAFARLKDAIDQLMVALTKRLTSSPLLPLGVFVQDDPFDSDVLAQGRDVRWAMARIARGLTAKQALAQAPAWVNADNVRAAYASLVGGNDDTAVSANATDDARNWLNVG